jgi:phytoene dehydrogenase-like protein
MARAGKKVLVLERRHVLGGAAVTEEVFPASGFRSVRMSFRCCGKRSSANLDLPRHGLEILPLDGTFTPMPNGDYLWRVNDHAKTRREIARHSRLDAEASRVRQGDGRNGRFVKPILNMTRPIPHR